MIYEIAHDAGKAEAFAERMSDDLGLRVESTTDLAGSIRLSDLCGMCTTSPTPLLYREHLHPGRLNEDEVFVFDSTGTALQDVAAAILVYERAAAEDAGLTIVFDDRHATRSQTGAA